MFALLALCLPSWSVMHDVCVTCAKKCAVAMGANVLNLRRLEIVSPFFQTNKHILSLDIVRVIISRYSDFRLVVLTNAGIFLRGLNLCGESRT